MKTMLALSLVVSSLAFGALTQEELTALKPLSIYYARSERSGDEWGLRMCPEVMGLAVSPEGITVLDHFRGRDTRIGLSDPESPRAHWGWNFPAEDINGKVEKITDWNEISNGLFNQPSPDPLFRKVKVKYEHKLTIAPNVRLVQTVTYTPYTLAFIRWGKKNVVTSELIETSEGVMMRRKIDGVEKRSCRYVPATKEQIEKADQDE